MIKIPEQREIDKGLYKLIDGIWHKCCTGPAHDEPVWLPATTKYFFIRSARKGSKVYLRSRCRLCSNWEKLQYPTKGLDTGWIEVHKVIHIYQEAANRIGVRELCKRTGVSKNHMWRVLNYKLTYVQKRKFKLILLELISIRRKNEYSINALAAAKIKHRGNGTMPLCTGCGRNVTEEEYTDGCKVCQDREASRKSRADPKKAARMRKVQNASRRRRRAAAKLNKLASSSILTTETDP